MLLFRVSIKTNERTCAVFRFQPSPTKTYARNIVRTFRTLQRCGMKLDYGRSAEVVLSRGQKHGDKSSPLLFGLVFNALLLALKASGVGHRTISGLRSPARGFADDLVIVTSAAADLSRLLQVVADFCAWSGMRIKREKSVVTGFDFRLGTDLPSAGILYEAPLTDLAAEEAVAYLGVRASLVGVVG